MHVSLRTGFLLPALVIPVMMCTLAQAQILQRDTLSLNRAVTLALEHHPSLRVAEADVRFASGALTTARSPFFPAISANASYTRTDGAFVLNPSIQARQQSYNTYTTGVQIQQILFDFGRTWNHVSSSSDLADASTLDARSAHDNVVVNVQLAYFDLVQQQRIEKVTELALQQAEDHLHQARAFYNAGRRPLFDVTKAEVDVANANVNLIRSRNLVRLANVRLENAMGIHPALSYDVTDTLSVAPFVMSMDSAKAAGLGQRPDILAARARLSSSEALASAAWDQHLPILSATGTWTWTNFNFPLYSRWNAGVTLSLPVFQGFAVVGQVEQAQADVDAAKANLDLLNESVMLEIEQTYLSLKEAEDRIAASAKLVEQAEQNLNLAEKQYAAGVGTPLDVTDAQVSLSNARITNIQSLYDYNSALVQLKRSIGELGL